MELREAVRPSRAQYQGRGIAVGTQIAISVGFDLSPLAEGTRIAWQGEAGVSGNLALLAGAMLKPLSKKNIEKLIDGLQRALAHPTAPAIAQPAPSEAVESAPAEQPPASVAEEVPGAGVQTPGPANPKKIGS